VEQESPQEIYKAKPILEKMRREDFPRHKILDTMVLLESDKGGQVSTFDIYFSGCLVYQTKVFRKILLFLQIGK